MIRPQKYLPLFMELAYLLYARKIEVLDLRRDDLLPEGVRMRRRKGSKDNVIRWSARLELAVNTALALPSTIGSMYLLHDRQGQPIKSSTLDTAWQRAELPFTPHDLKRKGLSEAVGGNPFGKLQDVVVIVTGLVGEPRSAGQSFGVEPFVEQELKVASREDVGHGSPGC